MNKRAETPFRLAANRCSRVGVLVRLCALAVMLTLFVGCSDEVPEHYREPEWLAGSIWQILEQEGDYTLFLQGAERADFRRIMEGKSILTVMAPDDAAMRDYLREHYGTDAVESLPVSELKRLIGFHILYYPFSRTMLENFRPIEGDGATDEEQMVNAGLYYKFRTRSQDAPEKVQPERMWSSALEMPVDTSGVTVDVYHQERFIPVFSPNMFITKRIDAARNYNYFFPHTEWNLTDGGFNVADAQVKEYEIIAKNGYVYPVDRVITPLLTIHDELAGNEQYSLYLSLYDAYGYYDLDETATETYGGGKVTYYKRHYLNPSFRMPDIDSEWPVANYASMDLLSKNAFSIFAPTNAAFDEFYRSYWGDEGTGYPSEVCYDSISGDAISKLLSNSIYADGVVFPDEITRGDVQNEAEHTVIRFDVDNVPQTGRRMCSNGVLYGQTILTPPAVFGSVTGPAYKYKHYSIFLKMLTASNMDQTLTSDAVNFVMLYPQNSQFEANNVWYDPETDKLKSGVPGTTTSSNLGSAAQSRYVNAHIVGLPGDAHPLPTTGLRVFRTLSTDYKLYWYVKDGRITNSLKYSTLIRYAGNMEVEKEDVYTDFHELTFRGDRWTNGHCYEYDTQRGTFLLEGSNENALYAKFIPMAYMHRNDEGTLFQGFIQLLLLADMIDEQAQTMNYMTENCIMLVPTTEAIKRAIVEGYMPYVKPTEGLTADDGDFWSKVIVPEDGSEEQNRFQHYMLEYFYPESTAPITEYPYHGFLADSGEDKNNRSGFLQSDFIPSIADISVTPSKSVFLRIYENDGEEHFMYSHSMSAHVAGNDDEPSTLVQPVPFVGDYDYLPFVFDDGCVQFLTDIFPDCWPHQ
ncbi:MAG: hypothetical protein J6T94_10140 [Bacteroidaceae bacterium]|nr:hypothetical protein [Bacteroidaceae bacterium]MBP5322778.1 hypothetical protein [Bacteroidaceae bacterium]